MRSEPKIFNLESQICNLRSLGLQLQRSQGCDYVLVLLREHGAQIQQDPAFFYASDDWRLRSAEARGYFIRAQTVARHGKQLGR